MTKKVSIITPCFNRAELVVETAQSIFDQSHTNWEWNIVDDGSTDHSWQVLEELAEQDERVKIYARDREPKGACTCRNIAVERSTGDYLIFLDTDDLLAPFCLEQRVGVMDENPHCDLAIFSMLMFKQRPGDMKVLWNVDSGLNDLDRLLFGDPVCQGTGTLWKKSSFIEIGMWNEGLLLWQDIDLHIRTFLSDLKYVKRLDLRPDVFIRVSDVSLSRTGFHSRNKYRSRVTVFQNLMSLIRDRDLYDQYKAGLRSMFNDLYLSGVQSGHQIEVRKLIALPGIMSFINQREMKLYKFYALVWRLKLYRLPIIPKYILGKIRKSVPVHGSTLNQVEYNETLELNYV